MLRPTFPQRAGDAEAGYRTLGTVPPDRAPGHDTTSEAVCALLDSMPEAHLVPRVVSERGQFRAQQRARTD